MIKTFSLFFIFFISLQFAWAQASDELSPQTKLYLENQIKEYEKQIVTNPRIKDHLRQRIVKHLISLNTSPNQILKKVGNGFQQPEKKLYFEIAAYLVKRGEFLDKALEFLRLEETVPYIWRGNDAYTPPCIWCVEAQVYFRLSQFQKVVDLIEPNVPKTQSFFPIHISFGQIDYKILATSYLKTGRLDDAINLYLIVVSESFDPSLENQKYLDEIYTKKYGGLSGLKEKIAEMNKAWRYNVFIKPDLINIPAPKVRLTNIYEKNMSLSDFAGKILVILFYPVPSDSLQRIVKLIEHKPDVVFIAIDNDYYTWRNYQKIEFSVEQRREKILANFGETKPNFPILLADQSNFAELKNSLGNMVSIIDRNGNIRFRNVPEGEPYFSEKLNYLLESQN